MLISKKGSGRAKDAVWLLVVALILFISISEVSCSTRSYYKILGVDKEADDRTIKRAYRVSILALPEGKKEERAKKGRKVINPVHFPPRKWHKSYIQISILTRKMSL
jgi:hypothetical protein